MNEEHLAKVNWNSKSKEKIQLSKWREQACFWRQNSNYHRKWREQACFSMFSRWRQISNSNRMRNICRNGARSEADLAQCGALALPPPFLFLCFFNAPFSASARAADPGHPAPRLRVVDLRTTSTCLDRIFESEKRFEYSPKKTIREYSTASFHP